MTRPRHHLTVDVEEYFHASALEPYLPRSRWPQIESRLIEGMSRLLDLLDEFNVRSTFFVLGMVARDHRDLVRALTDRGHEVASHGWDHRRVTHISRAEFRRQTRDTRALLQDLTGESVLGYRAPNFSITPGLEWALNILVEEGHTYDSSLYPVRRPGYGYPGGSGRIRILDLAAGPLVEVPPLTLRLVGERWPVGGGGSLRQFPLFPTLKALRRREESGEPGTLYVHPWELDPQQPRVPGIDWLTRVRHYRNLESTEGRLRHLLEGFRFQPIRTSLVEVRAGSV
jgi:polysaccharide deacetylase family protein (PEP-CTERM system associated)